MAKNLDDIRKKLNIENIDESEKKQLFQKFVDKGGKVIETEEEKKAKKLKKQPIIRQSKIYSSDPKNQANSEKYKKNNSSSQEKKASSEKKIMTKETIQQELKTTFFSKMGINLYSFFNKVTNINGHIFHPKFISTTTMDVYESLSELHRTAIILMKSKSLAEFDIRYYFFKKYPVFYEMLLRLNKMQSREIIDQIREKERTIPNGRLTSFDLEKEIIYLFKRFYIFLPYKKQISEAYREGFKIIEKKENLPPTLVESYMSKVREHVAFLFDKYIVKLFYAFLQVTKLNFKIDSREIPVFLEIQDRERIGGRISELEKEFLKEEEKIKEESKIKEDVSTEDKLKETEEKIQLPQETQKGLEIIENLDYNLLAADKNSPFIYYDKKDKVYRVAAILNFFEQEYSFAMTGNKIKYYMEHHEGMKFDPKKDLNEEYVEINTIMENIKEYSTHIKEISETENNNNIPAMQKHNLIHKATIQKAKISMSLRAKLGSTMNKVKMSLEKIRSDYHKFLADPESALRFNDNARKYRLEGKQTKEGLEEFYQFISAFHYLLTKGNLGGAGNVVR
ncbi:MAG TPA: hypothetical protein DHW82_00515 [Spirochaetia bacterium]|nr:MAG: hypothetical protein A2Y41_05325 [Spirochaetes bacterium GWB1_36_13]HCL55482.1 hypothetical protein [Spirochaetia bacterium]